MLEDEATPGTDKYLTMLHTSAQSKVMSLRIVVYVHV